MRHHILTTSVFTPVCRMYTEAKMCGPKGDALLHSILFSLLVQGRLRSAIEFVEFLLRQNDLSSAVALCWKSWQSDVLTLPLQQACDALGRLRLFDLILKTIFVFCTSQI